MVSTGPHAVLERKENRSTNSDGARFVQLPMTVILNPRLSDGAKVLYAVLLSHDLPDEKGRRKGYVWPSQHRLTEKTNQSTKQLISIPAQARWRRQ